MNQIERGFTVVAVYLGDILISGITAEDHLNNLRQQLKRLNDKRLRCRIEKCVFADDSVTYLGHTISRNGISKCPKSAAVPRCQHFLTSHNYVCFLDQGSSTTSSCLIYQPFLFRSII